MTRPVLHFLGGLLLPACAQQPEMNPTFPITVSEAQRLLDEMHENPKPLERPVVVAAGFADPGVISRDIAKRIRRATSDDGPIISVSFFWSLTFDACRDKLLAAVENEFPSDDPDLTTEVDVIGFSMGGLVARYAASPQPCGKRLNIHRLYTLSTPHRGARLAPLAPFDKRAAAMRAESEFLTALDNDLERGSYQIIPYVRLRDAVVGEHNAAPPGRDPWWVPNRPLSLSHTFAGMDPRLIADITRRLRGEEPLTRDPPTPVPQ